MDKEQLKNELYKFHKEVYNWIRSEFKDLMEIEDTYLFLNPSIWETETQFEPVSNGNGKEIQISFGYSYNAYAEADSFYVNEYDAFCHDALIGAFYTDDIYLFFKLEIVHEASHHIVDFMEEKYDFESTDSHDDYWKRWYKILRQKFINDYVPYYNRVSYGAIGFTK